MKKLTIIFALLIFGLSAQIVFGQKEKPSEKETFIKATHFLEENPLDKNAKKIREGALLYLIETKDVSVVICGNDFAKPIFDKKNKFSSELFGQYTFGMAAFKLENTDKSSDENAAQLAGFESMLKAYESIVKENPKAKFDAVEALLTKKNNGELAKLVADVGCKK